MCIPRYIDIDLHHGDAVEKAFYSSRRVVTVSFHKVRAAELFASGMEVGKERHWREGRGWHHSVDPCSCTKMQSNAQFLFRFDVRLLDNRSTSSYFTRELAQFQIVDQVCSESTFWLFHTNEYNAHASPPTPCCIKYTPFCLIVPRSWKVFCTQRGPQVFE